MTDRPPGYFVIVDPEGGEIAASRRDVSDLDRAQELQIVRELEAVMGEGCTVVFREQRT